MDLKNASSELSKIDLKFQMDNLKIDVLWFRVMQQSGSWILKRHNHSSYEFHLVAEGVCRVKLDDGGFVVKKGEFYLTAPHVYHQQVYNNSDDFIEYSINCDITTVQALENSEGQALLDIFRKSECRPVEDKFGATQYFYQALTEADNQTFGCFNNVKSITTMLLISIGRSMCGQEIEKYSIPIRKAGNEQRFEQIRKYIENNVCSRIATEDIAHHLYLSDKQVCRIISQHTGLSTKKYINSILLQKAKILLKDTNLSIKEISEMLGFTSEFYFSQFFKREEGYTSKQFRKNVQNT